MKTLIKTTVMILFLSSCSSNFNQDNKHPSASHNTSPSNIDELSASGNTELATEDLLLESNQQVFDKKDIFTSYAARLTEADSSRKLIRTVDARFKVKNVELASYAIEDIVVKHQGFIINTSLRSNINRTQRIPVSKDSTLVTTYYTITNTFIIRLPVQKLDAGIRDIVPLIEYLDYRIINAKDVTLDILANKLQLNRVKKNENKLEKALQNKNNKLSDTEKTEESLYNKQETADNAMIENLRLIDNVKYSTINLEIYQNEGVYREMIANPENIDEYKPGFGSEIIESLGSGWRALKQLILFLIELWPLWLVSVFVYWFVARRYLKK